MLLVTLVAIVLILGLDRMVLRDLAQSSELMEKEPGASRVLRGCCSPHLSR